jgi:hypothetical protein
VRGWRKNEACPISSAATRSDAGDGLRAVGNTPDEFATFIAQEIEKVTKLVRMAGIKPD